MNLIIEVTAIEQNKGAKEVSIDLSKVEDIIKAQSDKPPFNESMNNCGVGEDRACIIKLTDGKKIYVMGDSSEVWSKIRTAIEEQIKNK